MREIKITKEEIDDVKNRKMFGHLCSRIYKENGKWYHERFTADEDIIKNETTNIKDINKYLISEKLKMGLSFKAGLFYQFKYEKNNNTNDFIVLLPTSKEEAETFIKPKRN